MIILKITLALALMLVFSLFVYFKKCFKFWKNQNVYTETPTIPFGNAKTIIFNEEGAPAKFKKLYQICKKKSIPFCGFYFLTQPVLIAADLDLIKAIAKTDFDHFTDRVFYTSDTDPLSLHLGGLRGSRWRSMRNKLSPVFTPSKIKLMYKTVENGGLELVSEINALLSKNNSVELKKIASRYSMDVLVNCSFSLDCKTIKNQNMGYVAVGESFYSTTTRDSFIRLLCMIHPNLLEILNLKFTKPDIEKFFVNTIKNVVKHREENNIVKQDLLHTMLQIRNNVEIKENEIGSVKNTNNSSLSLSIYDIAAECLVFFMAGFESSSSLITFCLYELALNADCQNKVREEVTEMLKTHDNEFSYDFLMSLDYTQNCIKETLRKYPPLPLLMRKCTIDYRIPHTDVTLKKGAIIAIPVLGVHYDPKVYPNPKKFYPERFSRENSAERHPAAFLSYGIGPRNCLAYQLGYLISLSAVANLVFNFKFKLNPSTKVPLVIDPRIIIMRSKHDVVLDLERITHENAY